MKKHFVLLLLLLLWASGASAHRFRQFGGFYGYPGMGLSMGYGYGYGLGFGGPFGGGFWPYNYGYAYAPPVVAVPSQPPVYIERQIVAAPEPNYWYYCRNANAYYPYVRECPGGWEKVAPQPSNR